MKRTTSHATDIGKREKNEDCYATYEQPNGRLTSVVCDGLGGHEGGEIAADAASCSFMEATHGLKDLVGTDGAQARLLQGVNSANSAVADRTDRKPGRWSMGTTLLGVEITQGLLRWISVGDCPLFHYRAKGGGIVLLNVLHHSPVKKNLLTSALTGEKIEQTDLRADGIALLAGDTVILASDGIDTLSHQEITHVLENDRSTGDTTAQQLVNAALAKENPKQDNVTVVTIRINEV